MTSIHHRFDLKWQGNDLKLGRKVLVSIEPDPKWPKMWRIRLADGSLSGMLNLARAHDAARTIARRMLDQQQDAAVVPVTAPPIEKSPEGVG
jgi:hypothetical protein